MLTLGSPTLAAYSVTITALNNRWIHRQFSGITYPNSHRAVHLLSSLQQAPVSVRTENGLLASVVVLPDSDGWWTDLLIYFNINYVHTWSFFNISSIGWVIVAFSLTVIDAFTNIMENSSATISSTGLSIGCMWLWLLAVLICWLHVGPRSDIVNLTKAINAANANAYIATHSGSPPILVDSALNHHAVSLRRRQDIQFTETDELQSNPIYNYSRLFSWSLAVQEQVSAYVHFGDVFARPTGLVASGAVARLWVASVMACSLTFGTVGANVIIEWATPTKGLACRSGAALLYALASTIVWIMLISSSWLNYQTTTRRRRAVGAQLAALVLRRCGKILGLMNALWLVVLCVFDFAGVYNTCWCQSAYLTLGVRGYTVMIFTVEDVAAYRTPLVVSTLIAWYEYC
ncbi:hypothetical protein C8R44DRAFT_870643 [Mycena epipterygia]|nr:hypothetical protein C8R44DRAFT_870643 [Mycena epipterygia]